MQVFVINLDRSPGRLSFMMEQCKRLGLEFERFPGVDGASNVPAWLAGEFAGSPLTSGNIGCYAAHLCVAREIVARDLECALVLEDDVTLDDDFVAVALEARSSAPADWDVVHLCPNVKRPVVSLAEMSRGRHLVQFSRLPTSNGAYLLSHAGARKRLAPRPRVRSCDIDLLRCAWLHDTRLYGVFPAAAQQRENFPSDIGAYDPTPSPGFISEAYGLWWKASQLGFGTAASAWALGLVNDARRRIDGKRRIAVLRRGAAA